jgi:tetratricopeptide (TPR) repeat protein
MNGCPREDQLLAFLDGALSLQEKAEIDAHLGGCADCAQLFAASIEDQFPDLPNRSPEPGTAESSEPGAVTTDGPEAEEIETGGRIGRYLVLSPIGAGGIGIVYSAYDPQLGRQVALKLLRPEKNTRKDSSQRLVQEAQAMARLTHPNVVAVYDVGTWKSQVFIAMELITGGTLLDWRAVRERSWREIAVVFERAGRGLAAAHGAGVIHRDFKPENILMGEDGRVLVTDFGLARIADPSLPPIDLVRPDSGQPISSALTRTGTGHLVGSPAYMAPEQMDGKPVDERSDVFSFCVALHESLRGERPFAGGTLRDLREEIRLGKFRDLAKEVPPFLRKLIARGLAEDPAQRYPGMPELLTDLQLGLADRARPTWALVLGLVAFITLGGSLYVIEARLRDPSRLCPQQTARVAKVWNEEKREAITKVYAALGYNDGRDQPLTIQRGLDNYAEAWLNAQNESCRATRVKKVQPEPVFERRVACLDQRLDEFSSLIELILTKTDRVTMKHVSAAVASLSPVSSCEDSPIMRESLLPPSGGQIGEQLAAARLGFAEGRALLSVGAWQKAFDRLIRVEAAARELHYPALESEALLLQGRAEDHISHYANAERLLRDSAISGELARRDDLAAKAFCQLIFVSGNDLNHVEDALRWAEFAQAAIDRAGGALDLQSWREQHLGSVLANHKRANEALPHLKYALELAEKMALSVDAPELGTPVEAYAVGFVLARRYDEAMPLMRRALALLSRKFPPNHPNLSEMKINLGETLLLAGHLEEAETPSREALASLLVTDGPDNELTTVAEVDLSRILSAKHQLAEALVLAQKAVVTCSIRDRCESERAGDAWQAQGVVQLAMGHADEALKSIEQAVLLRGQGGGTDLPESQFLLAQLLWDNPATQPRARDLAAKARAGSLADDLPRVAKIDTWLTSKGQAQIVAAPVLH